MKYFGYIISFITGVFCMGLLLFIIKGKLQFEVNIIDLLMLVITSLLSIAIVFLSKKLESKDIIKSIITKDIEDLCSLYREFSMFLKSYDENTCTLEQLRLDIMFTFHRADLLVDGIKLEIEKSFPKYYEQNEKEFLLITTPYYKWLTGGLIFNDLKGKLPPEFIKQHETELSRTIYQLKLIIHALNMQG